MIYIYNIILYLYIYILCIYIVYECKYDNFQGSLVLLGLKQVVLGKTFRNVARQDFHRPACVEFPGGAKGALAGSCLGKVSKGAEDV